MKISDKNEIKKVFQIFLTFLISVIKERKSRNRFCYRISPIEIYLIIVNRHLCTVIVRTLPVIDNFWKFDYNWIHKFVSRWHLPFHLRWFKVKIQFVSNFKKIIFELFVKTNNFILFLFYFILFWFFL